MNTHKMSDFKTGHAAYPAQIFFSEDDCGYIATAPDLPGCSAFGRTQQEALAELAPAIKAWIEAARSAGNPIPEPARISIEPQPSGKLLLRLPRSLHSELIRGSKRENVSLNYHIVSLLTKASSFRLIESHALIVAQGFYATMMQRIVFATTIGMLDDRPRYPKLSKFTTLERLSLRPMKAEQSSALSDVQRTIHG